LNLKSVLSAIAADTSTKTSRMRTALARKKQQAICAVTVRAQQSPDWNRTRLKLETFAGGRRAFTQRLSVFRSGVIEIGSLTPTLSAIIFRQR
jgi:hypothetical protein